MTVAIFADALDIPQIRMTDHKEGHERPIVTEIPDVATQVQPALRTIFPVMELEDHPIDKTSPIRVVVVGAGIAGVTAGILLPQKVPNIDLTILERHDDIVRISSS